MTQGKPSINVYSFHYIVAHYNDNIHIINKQVLESITMNKAREGDGIPVELFQILEDDAVKVLHSICQQIWKTQQ